ncbi:MAG: hypothetical protein MZW92_06160 [Comamonadaceae bacterium]|nr:hypothetical protein [Comamonadaceae bacterium]
MLIGLAPTAAARCSRRSTGEDRRCCRQTEARIDALGLRCAASDARRTRTPREPTCSARWLPACCTATQRVRGRRLTRRSHGRAAVGRVAWRRAAPMLAGVFRGGATACWRRARDRGRR